MNFFKKIATNISLFFSKIFLFIDKHIVKKLKERELLKRILFTLLMMAIFVIIGTITLPGVKVEQNQNNSTSFLGIMNTIGGGGLRKFSLVSLGISPFITASLIMTFAQTKLFPPIYRLYHSGPVGRIKISYITHALTFGFAIIQGIVIIQSLVNGKQNFISIQIIDSFRTTLFIWVVLPFMLVAGSFFSMFISEQITNKGVGNGSSMLILAGSIITLPNMFQGAWLTWIQNRVGQELFQGIIYLFAFVLLFIGMVFVISFFYQAERRIPIQHIGVGRSKSVKDISYLPIKLNPAGIMPIIFASMLITFPMLIVNLVNEISPNSVTRWMITYFNLTNLIGLTIFASATFGITIFLSLQQSKIDKIVEDFNKSSTFIPGIRPGEQTEDYLYSIVLRLAFFSAIYLTILGSIQYILAFPQFGINPTLIMSGTSIMIIATVSIETIQQIEARKKVSSIFKVNSINVHDLVDEETEKSKENNEIFDYDGSILW